MLLYINHGQIRFLFALCPRVVGFRRAGARQQVLLPQKTLAVAAALAQLNGARIICASAGDKQFHISRLSKMPTTNLPYIF